MADITMCEGTGCKRKSLCYRFTAKPNGHRQAYFDKVPIYEDGNCPFFYDKNWTNVVHNTTERH